MGFEDYWPWPEGTSETPSDSSPNSDSPSDSDSLSYPVFGSIKEPLRDPQKDTSQKKITPQDTSQKKITPQELYLVSPLLYYLAYPEPEQGPKTLTDRIGSAITFFAGWAVICGLLSGVGYSVYRGNNYRPQPSEQKLMQLKAEQENFSSDFEAQIRKGYEELQKDGAVDDELRKYIPLKYRITSSEGTKK